MISVHWNQKHLLWSVREHPRRREPVIALLDCRFVFLPEPVRRTPFAWVEGVETSWIDFKEYPRRVLFDRERRCFTVDGEPIEIAPRVLFFISIDEDQKRHGEVRCG